MQTRGGGRDRTFGLRRTWSGSRCDHARRAPAGRRCRAAAAWCRARPRPGRAPDHGTRRRASPRPPSPFASTVASSWPRKQTLPSSPKRTTSPVASRFAGFTKARQRAPSRRWCSVASIAGSMAPRPMRRPRNRAGITLLSLTTSASPGRSRSDRSPHPSIRQFRRRAGAHDQQPRRIARDHGSQGDPVQRQFEIEQVGTHAPSYRGMRVRSSRASWRIRSSPITPRVCRDSEATRPAPGGSAARSICFHRWNLHRPPVELRSRYGRGCVKRCSQAPGMRAASMNQGEAHGRRHDQMPGDGTRHPDRHRSPIAKASRPRRSFSHASSARSAGPSMSGSPRRRGCARQPVGAQ